MATHRPRPVTAWLYPGPGASPCGARKCCSADTHGPFRSRRDRRGLGRLGGYVGDDAGDVVGGAAVHGQGDQVGGGLVGVGHGEQDAGDGVGGRGHVQAVGAEQVAVAGAGFAELDVGREEGVVEIAARLSATWTGVVP
jgi:hypothetical protein